MKPLAFAVVFVAAAPFAACSGDDVAPTVGTGGTGLVGNAGTGGTTGTTGGTGGTTGTTGGTGGTTGTTGGTTGTTGGTGGTAGTGTQTGGMAGTGVITGGSAGGPTGGTGNLGGMSGASTGGAGAGGLGGMAGTGSGGMSASGGMSGAASGGMSGSGGGPATCPTVAELFPTSGNLGSLDGRLMTTPCAPTNSDDCAGGGSIYNGTTTPCMGALTAQQDFAVGGTPGETYEVSMHFYGVVEPKNYGNMVTREAGGTRPTHMASGATPAPWASANAGVTFPASDYNTYEIHVLDDEGQEVRQYFLNSDTQEGHWTYLLNYERTFPVIGGGKVRVRTYDRNCRMIKNCGDRSGGVSYAVCGSATKQQVDVSAAMPAPTMLSQPGLGQAAAESGQWLLIDVTGVACE